MAAKNPDQPNIHKNIHPPLVAMFYIAIAYILKWFLPLPFHVSTLLQNAGFGLVIIGFLLGAGAFVEFRKARTTLNPHGSVSAIVTSGVYRFTRNPIYLGFLLMVIGLPLNAGTYYGILCAPFFVLSINRLVIEREETYLEQKFKQAYTAYQSKTRRWL